MIRWNDLHLLMRKSKQEKYFIFIYLLLHRLCLISGLTENLENSLNYHALVLSTLQLLFLPTYPHAINNLELKKQGLSFIPALPHPTLPAIKFGPGCP